MGDKHRNLNGSITVFLSLTLSFLMLMVLTFNALCIGNAEKMRFEIASDTAFNSVLGEYSKYLRDRFDLLYVDASYLSGNPGPDRVRNRLIFYMKKNTEEVLSTPGSPWGNMSIDECVVEDFETATGADGLNMASQAVKYVHDSPHTLELQAEAMEAMMNAPVAAVLDGQDPMEEINGYMEALLGMELPKKKNEKGMWIEVPLANPADWVYGLMGSDILYLSEASDLTISSAIIDTGNLISNRGAVNTKAGKDDYEYSEDAYIAYLLDKFGCYKNEMEETPLKCSLEYIAVGKSSDYENFKEVVMRIFKWRLVDNLRLAFSDGRLKGEAMAAALLLEVCTLNPAFVQPVADTIVAACAFLETISDLRVILSEGRIPLVKSSHNMSVANILTGNIYHASSDEGLSYRQYVEIMIINMEVSEKILRTMDLMEIETRQKTGNECFCMDWCMEEITAFLQASGSGIERYRIRRKYGYF